jgi:hypothetical protein
MRVGTQPCALLQKLLLAHLAVCMTLCHAGMCVQGQEPMPGIDDATVDESIASLGSTLDISTGDVKGSDASPPVDSLSAGVFSPSTPSATKDPLLFESDKVRVKLSVSGLAQAVGGTGSWWNLSQQFAPDQNYKPDRAWGEMWIKPGITTDLRFSDEVTAYSGMSYVGSGNIGNDVFEQGNRGLYSIEDAYFGTRLGRKEDGQTLDVSYGRQQYRIGSGMLISVGAYNGFERGATTSFARRAWEEAGLVKWRAGNVSVDGFYLNPNELKSGDTQTRLAGAKTEYALGDSQYVGLAYMNVFESISPYVGAPLQFFPNGREGLNTTHTYLRFNPMSETLPSFYFAGDYAYQWNDRMDMSSNSFSGEFGNAFVSVPWTPKLSYTFRSFQGDDPNTQRFEKFDPLFYEGSPTLWASGSNGSLSFLNSNLQTHRILVSLNVTQRDIIGFHYWHLRADQANSPLQFGQAGRIVVSGGEPRLVTGVPNQHLSDDFYVDHLRIISPNVFLNTGVAVSIPGKGLRSIIDDPATWVGGLMSLAFQY